MISFYEAIEEVGQWSKYNFGDQKGAEALAPLAGIAEERGEWAQACSKEDLVDAAVDQLVYLADLCFRGGFSIDREWNAYPEPLFRWDVTFGKLSHVMLKRHQGIRGYDNDPFYYAEAKEWAGELFNTIHFEFDDEVECVGVDLGEAFTETWNRVRNRDWKQNPVDAAKIVDQEVEALKQEQPFE